MEFESTSAQQRKLSIEKLVHSMGANCYQTLSEIVIKKYSLSDKGLHVRVQIHTQKHAHTSMCFMV